MSRSVQNATPRWTVLLGLGLGVLVLHLLLLGGGVGWSLAPEQRDEAQDPSKSTEQAQAGADPLQAPTSLVLPVSSSTVRFVPPKPAPPPPKPAPRPKKKPVPKPQPPVEPMVELPVVVAPAPPEPPTAVAETPAITPQTTPEPPAAPPPATAQASAAEPTTVLPGPSTATDIPANLPSLAGALAPSTELSFNATGLSKGLNYAANGLLSWQHDGQTYALRAEISAFLLGSRGQTSTGRVSAEGLAPERFLDRGRAAHFDRDSQRLRYSNNAPDAPLLPGTQDQLSVSLQLGLLLNADPAAYPPGHVLKLPVSSASASEIWAFEIGAEETLELPAGPITVRKLVRKPRREFDRTVEIWLAPSLYHLPVRLRITQANGDFVDQQLKRWPLLPKPAAPPLPAT